MKKTTNYLLLLILAMLTLNMQSCDEEDDDEQSQKEASTDTNSFVGTWKVVSYEKGELLKDVQMNDSVYLKLENSYCYAASMLKDSTWMVTRSTIKVKGDSIYFLPDTTDATLVINSASQLKEIAAYYSALFERATLPAAVDSMINNGKYGIWSETDDMISY